MMRAAREAAGKKRGSPKLLAVTVLTSIDAAQLKQAGIRRTVKEQVLYLAKLARNAGMDGVITSPLEVAAVRAACGPDFLIVVPGIRPATPSSSEGAHRSTAASIDRVTLEDQRRVSTPAAALQGGADYLVIGRPILDAADPVAAADAILREMAEAKRTPHTRMPRA